MPALQLFALSQEKTVTPHLRRELGLFDLTLLLIVAVVNVNILPRIAENGWKAITLWLLAFVLFLIPQGIAVAQFGKRYPGEGGIYIWTREMFGEFHAFLSGWCYWANNLFYFPSILLILSGVLVYSAGPEAASMAENTLFTGALALIFLWLITLFHIRGLSVGKWLNNIGAIGTWFSFLVLLLIAFLVIRKSGSPATPFRSEDLLPSFRDYGGFSAFSFVLYSLVGLELGSVMGDEIKNPDRIIGRAAFLGGVCSILLYVLGTVCLLVAIPAAELGAVQGFMQAVTAVAQDQNFGWAIPFVAILISLAVLGICSAWMSGAARIPFVMGVSAYLPEALGRTHAKWGTPYVALVAQAVLSSLFIIISLSASNISEAYEKLLSSSVAIQLIPFIYLFWGLWKLKVARVFALLGTIATTFGVVLVFVPSSEVKSVLRFELEVITSFLVVMGVAILFYVSGKRRRTRV